MQRNEERGGVEKGRGGSRVTNQVHAHLRDTTHKINEVHTHKHTHTHILRQR